MRRRVTRRSRLPGGERCAAVPSVRSARSWRDRRSTWATRGGDVVLDGDDPGAGIDYLTSACVGLGLDEPGLRVLEGVGGTVLDPVHDATGGPCGSSAVPAGGGARHSGCGVRGRGIPRRPSPSGRREPAAAASPRLRSHCREVSGEQLPQRLRVQWSAQTTLRQDHYSGSPEPARRADTADAVLEAMSTRTVLARIAVRGPVQGPGPPGVAWRAGRSLHRGRAQRATV